VFEIDRTFKRLEIVDRYMGPVDLHQAILTQTP
jgi:hypothetical protein